MPYLTPKPKKSSSWLPSQVVYGMDCSDDDPANWKPFGEHYEREASAAAAVKATSTSKPGQPVQSPRSEP